MTIYDLLGAIADAQKDVAIARKQFNEAAPMFVDAAVLKLNACEERLDTLLAEASQRNVRTDFVLPWLRDADVGITTSE